MRCHVLSQVVMRCHVSSTMVLHFGLQTGKCKHLRPAAGSAAVSIRRRDRPSRRRSSNTGGAAGEGPASSERSVT
jgi:hypothetical protein